MLSTLRAARAAAATPPSRSFAAAEPSLLWKLAHGSFDPVVPMSTALPGIPVPKDLPPPLQGTPAITTLANGVRVASQDNGGAVAAVGVYVGVGSRHENPYTAGAAHMLEHCAFKGSSARSKYRMVRDMERTGAGFNAAASRETMAFAAECLPGAVKDTVSILSEAAISPGISMGDEADIAHDAAVAELKLHVQAIKEEVVDYAADPAGRVTEAIHAAAFHGNTLGKFHAWLLGFFFCSVCCQRDARVCVGVNL